MNRLEQLRAKRLELIKNIAVTADQIAALDCEIEAMQMNLLEEDFESATGGGSVMCVRKRSDGHIKVVEGTDTGEPYVVLCGKTASGDIVPVLVDADGKIILST